MKSLRFALAPFAGRLFLTLCAFVGFPGGARSAMETDAVLLYTFDQGGDSKAVADDGPLKTFPGTVYGGAGYAPQTSGFAMAFDGGNSFIRCGRKGVPNLGVEDFSVAFWIKLEGPDSGTIIGQKGEEPASAGWMIETAPAGDGLLWTAGDGSNSDSVEIPLAEPDAWHQVTVVRVGNSVTAYVNGKQVSQKESEVFGADLHNPDVHLNLGKLIGKFRSFSGKLDEVAIQTRALKPEEIAKGYASTQEKMAGAEPTAGNPNGDSLVLHYRFENDPGNVAKDLSGHGNDGKIANAQYLGEVEGRKGVLRFDGEKASLDIGNPPSLQFGGDLSFEMWVRLNRPLNQKHDFKGYIFGEYPAVGRLRFGWTYYDNILAAYGNPKEPSYLPVARATIEDKWSHVAVVFEYPRARLYHDGKLVKDQIMLFPSATKLLGPKFLGGEPKQDKAPDVPDAERNNAPVDLTEFRLYSRALTASEIAAHAEGRESAGRVGEELAVEPDWYKGSVALRLTSKGRNLAGREAELGCLLDGKPLQPRKEPLRDVSGNRSERYVAEWTLPLAELKDRKVTFSAGVNGKEGWKVEREVVFAKPAWIQSGIGITDKVPAPWTPVKVEEKEDGTLQLNVWDRRYTFGSDPFPRQIEAKGANLLSGAMALKGEANGKPVVWEKGEVKVTSVSETAALLEQTHRSGDLLLKVTSSLEFDGYLIFDCVVEARTDVTLDRLVLDIPLQTKHAALCAAEHVYLPTPKVSMSESYWDAVRGDLDFRFAPSIWLGDNERGLTWQSESGKDWRNADPQKAIQIRPGKETTLFHANFVGDPTRLAAGQTLRYKFALLATPVKPMLRNAWDLRVMRSGPFGRDLELPDRTIDGVPQLKYLADVGVRNIYWHVANHNWPWPLPATEAMSKAIKRLNREARAVGLKLNPYALHIRFPIGVEEFDLYGPNIVMDPVKISAWGNGNPVTIAHPRPGPFAVAADTQLCVQYCPKSQPAQDAYLYALNKRFEEYGDSGVYLDGTGQVTPCSNPEHGCGYRDAEGKVHPTFPVFACREYIRRIYNTVKKNNPDGVVDLHYWHPNPAQAAYADINFTGEQWHQLRTTGTEYASGELTLERFRTMFMGYQVGTPTDLMSYRLGSTRRVAAISLLHDVPVRLNQGGRGLEQLKEGTSKVSAEDQPIAAKVHEDADYFKLLTTLWKIRDRFGINDAQRLFYWDNQDYVTVAPAKCYATLFRHPNNGVLAIVSNLDREKREVKVRFNLDKLGIGGKTIRAVNALTDEPLDLDAQGGVTVPLASEDWIYLWLRPADATALLERRAK